MSLDPIFAATSPPPGPPAPGTSTGSAPTGALELSAGAATTRPLAREAAAAPAGEAPQRPDGLEGQVLAGRYEVGAPLGAGGMGVVFQAHDRTKREQIAIKVLRRRFARSPAARARLLDEARIATRLSHPGVVKVHDVRRADGVCFLTMELLRGRTLRQELDARALTGRGWTPAEVTALGEQALAALSCVHAHAVHRDVKPENLWVGEDGALKLMDFGIARVPGARRLTQAGVALGTAGYMAPEQLARPDRVDGRADLYALGVVLHELLTGRLPSAEAGPLQRQRPDAPPRLCAAVQRALEVDPERRFPDAQAFSAALREDDRAQAPAGFESRRRTRGALVAFGLSSAAVAWACFGSRAAAQLRALSADPAEVAAAERAREGFTQALAAWSELTEAHPLPEPAELTAAKGEHARGLQALAAHRYPTAREAFARASSDATRAFEAAAHAARREAHRALHELAAVARAYGWEVSQDAEQGAAGLARGEAWLAAGAPREATAALLEVAAAARRARELRDDAPPELVLELPEVVITPAASLELSGRVRDATEVSLEVAGRAVALEASPAPEAWRFRWTLELPEEGWRRVPLVARDRAGREARVELRVLRDLTPPRLSVRRLDTQVLVGGEAYVEVAVEDESPSVRVLLPNAARLEVRPGEPRRVPLELTRAGRTDWRFHAEDPAGNHAEERTLSVVAAPCEPTLTGYAAAVERARTLEGFAPLEPQLASCAGRSFELARFRHTATGLVFHLVPGGAYLRVARADGASTAASPVRVAPFLLCATECTHAAWEALRGRQPGQLRSKERPVADVSWFDAQDFCAQAELRLPSEAEWEYACRAGGLGNFAHGDDEGGLGRYAVFGGARPETLPVASRAPNAFGLYDMHGNVAEWVQDAYTADLSEAPSDGRPHEPRAAPGRVNRGGSFRDDARFCRAGYRYWDEPKMNRPTLGFRPARSLP